MGPSPNMGLTLHQAPKTPIPEAITQFITSINTGIPRRIFTDGSFTLDALSPLLDTLPCTAIDLAARYAKAARGVYAPPSDRAPATALILPTPPGSAT